MTARLHEVLDESIVFDVIRQAWKRDPLAVLLSIPAAILGLLIVWLVLVVAIVAGTPA